MSWKSIFCLFLLISTAFTGANALQPVTITPLDTVRHDGINALAYGTFQSHNRMVVSNQNGVFVAYLQDSRPTDNFGIWTLKQSTDDGQTFHSILTEEGYSRAPCLETDPAGDIFLSYSTNNYTDAYFVKLLASEGYTPPHSILIPGAGAGKFSCAYHAQTGIFFLLGWSR
jgi:hypothetical protein